MVRKVVVHFFSAGLCIRKSRSGIVHNEFAGFHVAGWFVGHNILRGPSYEGHSQFVTQREISGLSRFSGSSSTSFVFRINVRKDKIANRAVRVQILFITHALQSFRLVRVCAK